MTWISSGGLLGVVAGGRLADYASQTAMRDHISRGGKEPLRVEVERSNDVIKVCFDDQAIGFDFSGSVTPAPPNEVFALWIALPVAMRKGRELVVVGAGCQTAAEHATELSRVWEYWNPTRFRTVEARFERQAESSRVEPSRAGRDIVLFSGGVDSTFNLVRRRESGAEQGLLTLHGLDYRHHDHERFEALKQHCAAFVSTVTDEWSFGSTDAYAVYRKYGVGPDISHGFLLAGALFMFEGLYGAGEIAADVNVAMDFSIHPWGTSSLTNPYFASSTFRMKTACLEFSRSEKLPLIRQHPGALNSLSFCKSYEHRPRNCGLCSKCVRTKAMFLAQLGEVPDIFLERRFPDGAFDSMKLESRADATHLADVIVAARRHKNVGRIPGLEEARKRFFPS